MIVLPVSFLVPGTARAVIARLDVPLSFWGGYSAEAGIVIDRTHPDCGRRLAGTIVAMREARGSSSASSTLVEAARIGTAPAAIILERRDPILTIGSLVAADLYGVDIPIALLDAIYWPQLGDGRTVSLDGPGSQILVED